LEHLIIISLLIIEVLIFNFFIIKRYSDNILHPKFDKKYFEKYLYYRIAITLYEGSKWYINNYVRILPLARTYYLFSFNLLNSYFVIYGFICTLPNDYNTISINTINLIISIVVFILLMILSITFCLKQKPALISFLSKIEYLDEQDKQLELYAILITMFISFLFSVFIICLFLLFLLCYIKKLGY